MQRSNNSTKERKLRSESNNEFFVTSIILITFKYTKKNQTRINFHKYLLINRL